MQNLTLLKPMEKSDKEYISKEEHLNIVKGWENKWKAAIELAAIAEIKLDEIRKIIKK